jgi:hypothetical protein
MMGCRLKKTFLMTITIAPTKRFCDSLGRFEAGFACCRKMHILIDIGELASVV